MLSIYKMEHPKEVADVLEDMQNRLAKEFGVTVVGNRVTVRWHLAGQLVDVHMIIDSVTTPSESADAQRQNAEFRALIEKYKKKAPDLAAELFHIEHGEWPQ